MISKKACIGAIFLSSLEFGKEFVNTFFNPLWITLVVRHLTIEIVFLLLRRLPGQIVEVRVTQGFIPYFIDLLKYQVKIFLYIQLSQGF
jgi:hypothetical protein